MIEIHDTDPQDTQYGIYFGVTLASGKKLNLHAKILVDFSDDVYFDCIFLGGVIDREQGKPLDLINCVGIDSEGNSVNLIRRLAEEVEITLEDHPDDESKAIWHIPCELHYNAKLRESDFGGSEADVEIANILVSAAFPDEMLMQDIE